MPSHRGRDLLIKIGDGEDPESFFTLGAARTVSVSVSNTPANATHLDSGGQQEWRADAGVQRMQITLDGFFKDTAAEEKLAAAAFSPTANNYRLFFPNGDVFAAEQVGDVPHVVEGHHAAGGIVRRVKEDRPR